MASSKKKSGNSGQNSTVGKWLNWYVNQGPMLTFGLKFGLLLVLLYVLLSIPFFDRALYCYLEANAWMANAILHGLGQPTQVSEVTIQSPRFAMAIRRGCDAVEPTWLVCAALVSFPSRIMPKVLGALAAIVLLQVMNLIRIVSLYWIGIYFPGFFNTAHVEIWPTVFIVVSILYFLGWKEWSQRQENAKVN